MLIQNLGTAKAKFPQIQVSVVSLAIILLMAISACASVPSASTPLPTQNLIVFTPTQTALPIIPTSTPSPTADTSNLITPTPFDPSLASGEQIVVSQAVDDLTQRANTTLSNIEFLRVERVLWVDPFDCEDRESATISEGVTGYKIWLLVDNLVYEYHTDQVNIQFCMEINALDTEPELLILVDPIASDLLTLAQRRVAETLNISTRRVEVLNLATAQWEDSSLGCPIEGQTYTPVEANGYLIELGAGGDIYTFHTSFSHVVLCTTEPESNDN